LAYLSFVRYFAGSLRAQFWLNNERHSVFMIDTSWSIVGEGSMDSPASENRILDAGYGMITFLRYEVISLRIMLSYWARPDKRPAAEPAEGVEYLINRFGVDHAGESAVRGF